ncbi:MAG: sulfatase-like hydrolase/transferase, partial [Gemmatimonadaceae bacterium]
MIEPQAPPPRTAGASDLIWLALAATSVAVVANVTAVQIRGRLLHQFTWTTSDLPWMSLVGNAIIFGTIALLLWGIGRVSRWMRRLSIAVAVFASLTALSVLLLITAIWQYASLALTLGATAALVRASKNSPASFLRSVRRVAAVCFALALVAAGLSLSRDSAPSEPVADTATDAPNVLLIILDTVRAASTSLYGYGLRTTPALESIAREGVVFDQAVATAPWTLPSHCSLFTGRDAEQTACRWNAPLDGEPTTISEVLRQRGYRTGGFVANHFYTTRETGLSRGFDRWADFQRTWKEVFCATVLVQTGIVRNAVWGTTVRQRLSGLRRMRLRGDPKPEHDRKTAAAVNAELLRWIDTTPGRPFFAFLNYFDAHDPYAAPPPFDRAFPKASNAQDQYDGGIAYMDQQLGTLMSELRRRGVLDHTVVVIASDHGELFGEHELFGHGNSLYWPLLHVPLVMRYPSRIAAGTHDARVVSLRDVPATILDLAGAPDLRIGG